MASILGFIIDICFSGIDLLLQTRRRREGRKREGQGRNDTTKGDKARGVTIVRGPDVD
jgi:hypothetical protein